MNEKKKQINKIKLFLENVPFSPRMSRNLKIVIVSVRT